MAGLVLLITGTRMPLTNEGMERVARILEDNVRSAVAARQHIIVMHGDCPTGVDSYVEHSSYVRGETWPFPAKWKEQGKPAGRARNTYMVTLAKGFKLYGHEVKCLAFPSTTYGSGTQHCIKEAKRYGLTTRVFPLEPEIHHNLTK